MVLTWDGIHDNLEVYLPALFMKGPGGEDAPLTTSLPTIQSSLLTQLLYSESRLLGETVETRSGKIQCGPCVHCSGKHGCAKNTSGVVFQGCRNLMKGTLGAKWETV